MNANRMFKEYLAQVLVESVDCKTWVNFEIRVKLSALIQICVEELHGNQYRILGYDKVTGQWHEVLSACNGNVVDIPLELKRMTIIPKEVRMCVKHEAIV